ncbi:MAG: penicillin-binding protein activator, partial [Candidatus Delongbacteria bacterium]|nr:penicillin-binding protein activator [Candidatus Delongbacteria bacterium]
QSLHELIIEKLEIEELIRLAENSDALSFRNSIYFSIADRYTRNFDFPKAIGYWEKIDSQADSPEARARLEQCRNAMMAPLRIGLIGPLSGEYSSYGSAMIRGVSIALDYYNSRSLLPVRFIPYDNRNEPILTAQLTRQMIREDSIHAVIGPIRSMNAIAAGIVASDYQIPLIAPMIMIDDFNQLGFNLFQLSTPPRIQGELIAAYAIKQLGLKYFAVIAPNSTYGHSISQSFVKTVRQFSAHLIDTLWYDPADADFNPIIEQLRQIILNTPTYQHLIQPVSTIKGENKQIIRIDGIFIPAEKVQDIITVLPQLNYNLISCRFIGNSSWLDDQLFHLSGHLLDSVVIASDDRLSRNDSLNLKFETDYQTRYHQLPDRIAKKSYDAALLTLEALNPYPDSSRDTAGYLGRIENYEGVSGRINLKKNYGVNSQLYFYRIKDRRYIELP